MDRPPKNAMGVFSSMYMASCTPRWDSTLRKRFISQVSCARLSVSSLNLATATAWSRNLGACTQHTVASARVHKSTSGANGAAIETRHKAQRCDALERRISAEGLQLIWSVSRRVPVLTQHSMRQQHRHTAFCQPLEPRIALSPDHILLHTLSGRRSRCVKQQL